MNSLVSLDQAARPILWNIEGVWNVILMYLLFAASLMVFALGAFRHAELWMAGEASNLKPKTLVERLTSLYRWSLLQKGVRKKTYSGLIIHGLLYLGFLTLLFATTMVFIENDLGIPVYHGRFYLGVTLLSDVLGFGVIIACALALHRRFVLKPDMLHSRRSDTGVLWFIILLCVQGFGLEALRIVGNGDPWAAYSPIGNLLADVFLLAPKSLIAPLHYGLWWFHTLTVFVGIALIPYSKLWHIFSSSANLFFKPFDRPTATLVSPGDIEQMMEQSDDLKIGLATIKDYSWKQLLDLDACTSCGRCQEVCPAYISGKPLSPKWLILDSRNHALALHNKDEISADSRVPKVLREADASLNNMFFRTLGVEGDNYENGGAFRGANPLVQKSALAIGQSADHRMAGEVLDQDVFWSCTTCMACVEACPVGINHVDQIVGNRQNLTMIQGEVPKEAQNMLRLLENQGQTFSSTDTRTTWASGLDVRVLQPGDKVDYLYWVGCISAFDPRKQRIAQSLVKIMKKAGLEFGILGDAEKCTGDPARRVGNELLYQMMTKENIATLSEVRFNTMVANCPHCFNTLKNEYPEFGTLSKDGTAPRVIHHTQLIRELIDTKQLVVPPLRQMDGKTESITFHDPCYLGRGNNEYSAPRSILENVSGAVPLEMEMNKKQGMCCGAGGGHFWMDLKQGERINSIRTDQAAATGASVIATGCPFCMQMMEDGIKLTNRDSSLKVQDVAEVVVTAIEQ